MKILNLLSICLCFLATPLLAEAEPEAEQCRDLNIGVVDWTDLHVVNGVAKALLEELGYKVSLQMEPATPQVFEKLASRRIDVFMGYWTPAMSPIAEPYFSSGAVETISSNLNEARWTLAVPDYVYEQGLRNFADISRFSEKLQGRIYGLEKGSSGNAAILDMIDSDAFGLKDFKLIETTERIMMAQVKGKVRRGQWIVFMGWQPHPMNINYSIRYLGGGDDYFGPDYGAAIVNTTVRSGLTEQCPNLRRFFTNLTFKASIEEEMMDQVGKFVPVDRAVRHWMYQNPGQVKEWLQGVTYFNGAAVNPSAMASGMELTMSGQ